MGNCCKSKQSKLPSNLQSSPSDENSQTIVIEAPIIKKEIKCSYFQKQDQNPSNSPRTNGSTTNQGATPEAPRGEFLNHELNLIVKFKKFKV